MVDILIKIKEFANLCGCSVHTLRYYDSINLLKPVKVDKKSGYRFYRKSQVEKFIKIQRFKEIGFELDEIKSLDNMTNEEIVDFIIKKIDDYRYNLDRILDKANDYMLKYDSKEEACKAMLKNQVIKCTTSGFLTGFGGFITMPVTVPANIGSVIYVQMRMIACAAYMADYELDSDQTQTLVYACLAGVSLNGLVKRFGIEFGKKFTTSMIKKIPGKVLTQINQKVGFRFITKFGTKGMVNLGKLVPGVGAVISGSLDFVETKAIAKRTYKWFFEDNFVGSENEEKEDNFADVEFVDVDFENVEE